MKNEANDLLFAHPMNKLMLQDSPLTQYDPQELAIKYIAIAKSGKMPTDSQVEAVRLGLTEYCQKVWGENKAALERDLNGIEKSWPMMRQLLSKSMGLTQMMLDYGVNSRYFYQYVYVANQKMFAVALENKDGRAMPLSGEKVLEPIPLDDWAIVTGVEDPNHSARRGTDAVCQSLLRGAKTIFECGAGLMPAYRNYGYPLGQLDQRIVACDSDERLADFFPSAFDGRSLQSCNIDYLFGNAKQIMDNPEFFGKFKVVRMTGFLSYFRNFEDKLDVMRKAKRLLTDDGVIVTDLWVMGPAVARSGMIGIWPVDPNDPYLLTPSADIATAINEMTTICDDIGLPFVHTSDIINGNPIYWSQIRAVPKCEIFVVGKSATLSMLDIPNA